MSDIQILEQPAEEMVNLDQTFDLVYMEQPFGLQRDRKMQESDGSEKSFSDHWTSLMIIKTGMPKLNKDGWTTATTISSVCFSNPTDC